MGLLAFELVALPDSRERLAMPRAALVSQMKTYRRGFSHLMRSARQHHQPPAEEMNPTTTAVAPKPKVALTIKDRIQGDEFRKAVAHVLPKHLTPDRFVRIAIMAITRTPKLTECDQASFFGALMTLSQLGLEPDGRRAHLIPFRNTKRNCMECQLIVDWKGLAELAMRSGMVSYLHADIVSEGDLFEYDMGRVVKHVPWFLRRDNAKPEDPGEVVAAYAFAEFKDQTRKAEVMSIREVEGIRARSKASDSGPWVTDWSEMAKKTAFRRLSKWLPLSPEFRDAVDKDDDILTQFVEANELKKRIAAAQSFDSLVEVYRWMQTDHADENAA